MMPLRTIFADCRMGLVHTDGREVDDAGYVRQPLPFKFGEDHADLADAVRFGPWRASYRGAVAGWAIYDAGGNVLDAGPLAFVRFPLAGDEIVFPAHSIRSAAVGDILGITCVFMPSGFAVGVPPAPTDHPGGYVGYPEQEQQVVPFWLPKRRWTFIPEGTWRHDLAGWRERVIVPDVGAKEYQRSALAEMLLGIGSVEL